MISAGPEDPEQFRVNAHDYSYTVTCEALNVFVPDHHEEEVVVEENEEDWEDEDDDGGGEELYVYKDENAPPEDYVHGIFVVKTFGVTFHDAPVHVAKDTWRRGEPQEKYVDSSEEECEEEREESSHGEGKREDSTCSKDERGDSTDGEKKREDSASGEEERDDSGNIAKST